MLQPEAEESGTPLQHMVPDTGTSGKRKELFTPSPATALRLQPAESVCSSSSSRPWRKPEPPAELVDFLHCWALGLRAVAISRLCNVSRTSGAKHKIHSTRHKCNLALQAIF